MTTFISREEQGDRPLVMPGQRVPLAALLGAQRVPLAALTRSGETDSSPDLTNLNRAASGLGVARTAASLSGLSVPWLDFAGGILRGALAVAGPGPPVPRALGGASAVIGTLSAANRIPVLAPYVPGLVTAAGQTIPALSVPATVIPPSFDLAGPVGQASTVAGGTSVTGLGLAGGALQIAGGIHTLTSGGNEGAGAANIVGGALTALGVPVIGTMAALAYPLHTLAAGGGRRARAQRAHGRAREAHDVFNRASEALTAARTPGQLRAAMEADMGGGARLGDLLLSLAEQNLSGETGALYGWAPDQRNTAAATFLRQRGYGREYSSERDGGGGRLGSSHEVFGYLGRVSRHATPAREEGYDYWRQLLEPGADYLSRVAPNLVTPLGRPEALRRVSDYYIDRIDPVVSRSDPTLRPPTTTPEGRTMALVNAAARDVPPPFRAEIGGLDMNGEPIVVETHVPLPRTTEMSGPQRLFAEHLDLVTPGWSAQLEEERIRDWHLAAPYRARVLEDSRAAG